VCCGQISISRFIYIRIEGIIVCTSIKLDAKDRNIPCHMNAKKFILETFSVNEKFII
jgi:hypothetical protein